MDTEECKTACNELQITLSSAAFKDGKPCYKGGNGKCSQNGRNGNRATMVCTYKGNLLQKLYLCINNIINVMLQNDLDSNFTD